MHMLHTTHAQEQKRKGARQQGKTECEHLFHLKLKTS